MIRLLVYLDNGEACELETKNVISFIGQNTLCNESQRMLSDCETEMDET